MRKYNTVSEVKAKLEQDIKKLEQELNELDDDFFADIIELQIEQKREMLTDKDFLIGQTK